MRPRADKGSVLGLLARVYLNAEVYTGTPAWNECKTVCEKIFGLGYSLCSNYEHLFRGDNGENANAYNEFLFYAPYDWDKAQSWGGGTFLTCAAINTSELTEDLGDGNLSSRIGAGNGWLGLHVHEHFVNTHFKPTNVTWGDNGTCTIADQRGAYAFITARREKGDFSALLNTFMQGYGCWKFNNIPSYETGLEYWQRTQNVDRSTDIDYPLIRLGEIYLIYAEACSRLGQGATAQAKMNELAERTGVAAITVPATWSDEAMKLFREERARELYWEGHRRTDHIRYNCFTSGDYVWPFKGGDVEGKAFEDYKKLFAIPSSQILANPYLKNPEGY